MLRSLGSNNIIGWLGKIILSWEDRNRKQIFAYLDFLYCQSD